MQFFILAAEAIQNGSGFGFNGYDENGKAKWDLVQNVVIRHVEVDVVNSNYIRFCHLRPTFGFSNSGR